MGIETGAATSALFIASVFVLFFPQYLTGAQIISFPSPPS
jgi:hypothetical protein